LLKEIPWMLLHGKSKNWCLHLLFANWYVYISAFSFIAELEVGFLIHKDDDDDDDS
jgi:hypothetical protein